MQSAQLDTIRMELDAFRMRLNHYYSDGKLHKADYELLVNKLQEKMKMVANRPSEGAPTKSVNKMKRYTSEGKPITDEK